LIKTLKDREKRRRGEREKGGRELVRTRFDIKPGKCVRF